MEQIVAAVMAALPSLAAETVSASLKDAYSALKALIQRKWGEKGEVTKSLEALEREPLSKERGLNFRRHAEASGLHQDADIQAAAQRLIDALAGKDAAVVAPEVTVNQSGATLSNSIGVIGVSNAPITLGERRREDL
jgi:hypothetical protein